MEKSCYTLAVRQRTCQNGIAKNIENVYTNVSNNTIISLSFGYSATYLSSTNAFCTIQISNPNYIPNMIFNIPSGSYKIFDLPAQNSTLHIYIGATSIPCGDTVICCNLPTC